MGIIEWANRRESRLQRQAFRVLKAGSSLRFPTIPLLHHLLLAERRFRKGPLRLLWSKIYHEPLFRLQCVEVGPILLLHEDMPKIIGNLAIHLGNRVTLSGAQVWVAGGSGPRKDLHIGNNTYLGHGVELVVGETLRIGQHVRIANWVSISGYDGHPLDPLARARNEPLEADRYGTVVIGDYAWIGSDSTILKGVTVGRGAIVASCSVVTADVPELTIVAGNPARVVRKLAEPAGWRSLSESTVETPVHSSTP